jgi:hypothetical protein
MSVPKMQKHSFLRSAEGRIGSYDWFDFATGAGYKKFYCVGGKNSVGAIYFLSSNLMESDAENTGTGNVGSGTYDYDFDITFGRPVTIAAADAFFRHKQSSTTAGNWCYMTINVYKVDLAAAETLIGQGVGDTTSGVSLNQVKMIKWALTKTSIGVGEKIRVNLIFTTNGNYTSFQYDNGTSGNECYIYLPFVVDL